jgi:WD40 repeat protein/tetratricopeptide (TPR) repeat protein
MNSDYSKIGEIFAEAIAIPDPTARQSFIDAACAENPALRGQLEALLYSHENAGEFLHRSFVPFVPPPAESRTEAPGMQIGRYKLLQQIGEGGFGIVFMAEQLEPVQRKVALKVIKPGMDSKEIIARFEAERQALALMDHPNVARVLDGGTTPVGRPYFVMDLVKGIPITEFCDQNLLPPKDRLNLFIRVCAGIQHAHQKGIIHRDLKPTNVLVTVEDGVPVPKVIDFGIAKAMGQKLTELTFFTRFEQLLGTPAYMSPEQAEWSGVDVDTRSDIYSLGVLLYELLTGTTPFEKETIARAALAEVRRMIRETEPPTPSMRLQGLGQRLDEIARRRHIEPPLLTKAVLGDLDWIVMRSLEKDRSRRYESANALARDVARHLGGEPVVARPPSAAYRTGKFVRRHREAVTASVAGLLALVALILCAFLWQARQTREARRLAEENRRQVARYQVARGQRLIGQRLIEENDGWPASLPLFAEALRNVSGDPAAENIHRMRLASVLDQCPKLLRLFTNSEPFASCVFSPNGSNVLALSEHGLKVFEVGSGHLLYEISTHRDVYQRVLPTWTADGQRIVVRSLELGFNPEVYRASDGHAIALRPHSGKEAARLLDTVDGRTGLVAEDDFTARIYDLESGAVVSPAVTVREKIVGGRLTADQARFALVIGETGEKSRLQVWDARTGRVGGPEVDIDRSGPRSGAFILSQDGARVCIGSPSWGVAFEMFETATGKAAKFPLPGATFEAIPTSEGFQWLRAKSGRDDWLFWNLDTGEQFHLYGDIVPYRFLGFHPGGLLVATVTDSGTAFVVNKLTSEKVTQPIRHAKWAYAAAFSPDGRLLASCSADCTLRLSDLANTRIPDFTLRHSGAVTGLAVSPDGSRLATVGPNVDTPRLWDATTGRPVGEPFDRHVTEVFFSNDGAKLLTLDSGEFGALSLTGPYWHWQTTGFLVAQTKDYRTLRWLDEFELMWGARFTPDGNQIVTAPWTGPLRVWDLARGTVATSFTNSGPGANRCFALSPDGRRCASGTQTGPVYLWEVATGKGVGELPGAFDSVVFSPDGSLIATGGGDQCARVWAVPSLTPVTPPLFQGGTPMKEKFSPDGKLLLSRGQGTGLKLWDIKTGRLLFGLNHPGPIPDFGFSKDGKYIAAGGDTVLVWDTATGELAAFLPKHFGTVYQVKFSPNDDRIFTAGADGNVRTWKFTRTDYSEEDVKELAELLASARLDPTGALMPLFPDELLTRYEHSRSRHPEMFVPSNARQQALWHSQISELAAMSNQWSAVVWHLDRALHVDPSLAETPTADELFMRRGQARAETGDLSGAAADFERAVQLDSSKLWHNWGALALSLLASGAQEKYETVCTQLLKRFSERTARTNIPGALDASNAALLCTWGPNVTGNNQQTLELIEHAIEVVERAMAEPNSDSLGANKGFHHFLDLELGQALYRAGRYTEAIQTLQQACTVGADFDDLFCLSMAHSKLGLSDEAHRVFTNALDRWKADSTNWNDRVYYQLRRNEAEKLLNEGKQAGTDQARRNE